jgi:hypothetical protein
LGGSARLGMLQLGKSGLVECPMGASAWNLFVMQVLRSSEMFGKYGPIKKVCLRLFDISRRDLQSFA